MKIDFFHFGKEGYYQLRSYHEQGLMEALQKFGVEVRSIREESHTVREELQRLWSDPPEATLSIDYAAVRAFGLHELQIPHFHLMLHDLYPLPFRTGYGQRILFPHPAIRESEISPSRPGAKIAFFGSYRDAEAVKKLLPQDFSPPLCQMIIEGGTVAPELLLGVNEQAVHFVTHYIRQGERTTKMLDAFKDQSVDIYGSPRGENSWKDFACSYPRFSVKAPLPAHEVVEAMSRYALILAPDAGLSLRLLQGLAAGVEVMTYRHPEVYHYFGKGAGVRYWGEENPLQDVRLGQEILKRHFTWATRAQELLNGLG